MEKYLEKSNITIDKPNVADYVADYATIRQGSDFIVVDKSDIPALIEFLNKVLNSK